MTPWCPVPKTVLREILRNTRAPFSEEIAFLSVTLDCDEKRPVSVAGYAALWGWGQGRVRRFLARIGAGIKYPESTRSLQNQRGEIVIQIPERSRRDTGEIAIINFNHLQAETERCRRDAEVIAERSRYATKDTNNNKEDIPFSEIISILNSATGKSFRDTTEKTRRHIYARWNEGFRLPDFQRVIHTRCDVWGSVKGQRY